MTRIQTVFERVRLTFFVIPAACIALGAVLGFILPALDSSLNLPDRVSFDGGADTARSLLQAIVGLAVSVAGISFSVIVVALVLAAQQLSPRVLRSFQRHPLNQLVLGVFLGTATYAVCVLSAVGDDPANPVPELSTTVAMALAAVSLVLFTLFLHHLMRSLNASAVIRRIASEGQQAIEDPYPSRAGCEPEDEAALEADIDGRLQQQVMQTVSAPRAGYLATVKATELFDCAVEADVFVEQGPSIGEFVITGAELARVWSAKGVGGKVKEQISAAFVLNEERTVDHDIAFPIRQLADVALRGLSPGINDPTTAENAMDSLTDMLVRVTRQHRGSCLRVDESHAVRLRAARPTFDELVTGGFDQVRRDGAARPSFAIRLLELLAQLRDLGGPEASDSAEIARQAELLREHAVSVAPTEGDRSSIQDAYRRLHTGAPSSVSG